jgi:hypothetical protein
MYSSLTMLASDQPGEAQEKSRLRRLWRHRTSVPMGMAIAYLAIVMIGVATMVMGVATRDFPWLGYVIAALLVIRFSFAARRKFRLAKMDILWQCTQAEDQFQFTDARITGHEVRTEGSGANSYEVIAATVSYHHPGERRALEIVETFDQSIWNFERGQYPIPARVVMQRENPAWAALINISKSAIDAIPPGKKRKATGSALGFALVILVFVMALAFLVVALMMLAEKLGLRVR